MNKNFPDVEAYKKWFMEADAFGKLIGVRVISLTEKECVFEYDVNPKHLNPNGILHGAALFGAMDSSQGLFVHHILNHSFRAAATGTATVRYAAPVRSGTIRIRTFVTETQERKLFITSLAEESSGKEVAKLDAIWITIK